MSVQTVLTSDTAGPLFTVNLPQAAQLAYSIVVTGANPYQLSYLVNSYIQEAEAAQPEQTELELQMTGWRNPVTGTDYSPDIANYVNQQWLAGNVYNQDGTLVEPWQGANSIATGGGGVVTLRWTKGQLGLVGILIVVVAGLVALAILVGEIKSWTMSKNVTGAVTTPGTSGSFWSRIPLWEKLLGGAILVGGLISYISYQEKRGIAAAGATKTSQIIEIYPGR